MPPPTFRRQLRRRRSLRHQARLPPPYPPSPISEERGSIMPAQPSKGVFSRRVAPFAPVALALLAQGGVLGTGAGSGAAAPTPGDTQPAVCSEDIADSQTCHSQFPTGCSAKAGYDGYLNYLKNQLIDPARTPQQFITPADLVALDAQLPEGLAKNNHGDFV